MSQLEWLDQFSSNLKSLLHESRMSQRELADAAGVSESTISDYVNKVYVPSVPSIINIAYALDITIDELIDFGSRVY